MDSIQCLTRGVAASNSLFGFWPSAFCRSCSHWSVGSHPQSGMRVGNSNWTFWCTKSKLHTSHQSPSMIKSMATDKSISPRCLCISFFANYATNCQIVSQIVPWTPMLSDAPATWPYCQVTQGHGYVLRENPSWKMLVHCPFSNSNRPSLFKHLQENHIDIGFYSFISLPSSQLGGTEMWSHWAVPHWVFSYFQLLLLFFRTPSSTRILGVPAQLSCTHFTISLLRFLASALCSGISRIASWEQKKLPSAYSQMHLVKGHGMIQM